MSEGFTREYHFIRDLLLRLPKPTATHYAVLKAVSRLTIGWNKPEGDTISYGQIAEECFCNPRTVKRIIRDLEKSDILLTFRLGKGSMKHIQINGSGDNLARQWGQNGPSSGDNLAHTKERKQNQRKTGAKRDYRAGNVTPLAPLSLLKKNYQEEERHA